MANGKSFKVGFVFGAKKDSTFGKTFGDINQSIGKVVKSLASVAATVISFNAVKDAVNTFATFEQSMANVKAISGATAEEFAALESAALEMGRRTSKTAAESADALGYMALAGWDTQQSIKGLEPVLRASEAFTMDLATASDLVTDSMSAMGIAVDDLGGYLDVVSKAQSSANANGQQMMEAYLNVGGKLKDMNADMSESASILGVMANRGIKGSEAGNSLNTILMRMTASTGESSKAMKSLGISAFDAQGQWRPMEDIFMDVQNALSGMSEQQQSYYKDMIAGKNHSASFAAILDGLGNEYIDLKEKIADSDGALLQTAETMNNTMQGAFKRLESATDDMKIQFVKTFEKGLSGSINFVAEKIPVITGKITQGIEWIGKKAAPVFTAIKDNAIASITFIKTKWDQYGPSIIAFFGTVRDRAVSAFTWIRDTGQTAISNIQAKFQEIQPHVQNFIGAVVDIGTSIKEKLQGAFETAKPVIEWVITEGFPAVIGTAGAVLGKISEVYYFFRDNWSAIAPIISGITAAVIAYKVATVAMSAAQKIMTTVTAAMTVAQQAFNVVMNANPIGIVVTAIGLLVAAGVALYQNWDVVKAKAAELWEGIKGVFGGIVGWFGGIWDGIKSGFKGFINFIIGGLNKIPQGLNKLQVNIPDWVPGVGGKTLGFAIPEIPYLAKGGIATKPTVAMVGEGKEHEAIMPLSKLQGLLNRQGGPAAAPMPAFSPVLNFYGPAGEKEVTGAVKTAFEEFKKLMHQYEAEKRRKGLAT